MAWEQILTSGTSIGKLVDVTLDENNLDDGDILILNDANVFVNQHIQGTSNEVVVALGSGTIQIGQPDNVTIGQDLTVTRNGSVGGTLGVTLDTTLSADLTVNGGAVTLNAGAVGEDATLTLNGGATAKSAIIALSADAGATVGDNWEVKVADGGVMTFTNDAAALNEQVAMASWTPHSTAASSKLVLAGDLHVNGDEIKLGSDSTLKYTSQTLTITEGTIALVGAATVSAGLGVTGAITGSTTVSAATSVKTPLIEYTDGDDAITIADGGGITTGSTLTVGTDGVGHDVVFYSGTAGDNFTWDASEEKLTITGTDGATALDIADGNLDVDGTVTVGANTAGHDVKFFGASSSNYMLWDASLDDLKLVGSSASITVAGTSTLTGAVDTAAGLTVGTDLVVTGNDISGSGGPAISIGDAAAGNIDVINNLTVRGNTIYGYVSSSAVEMLQFSGTGDVNIKNDLSVDNDLVVDGDLTISGTTTTVNTATVLIEDNILRLNSGLGNVTPTKDSGFTVNRGNQTNDASFFWQEAADGNVTSSDATINETNSANTSYGGAWAMGYTESAATQGVINDITGYVVGVTTAGSGTGGDSGGRGTGLGSLFINTGTDAVYIRVS